MRHAAALLLSLAFIVPVVASEPGQPLDCSDWVFPIPGFSCAVFAAPPCGSAFCGGHYDGGQYDWAYDNIPLGNPRAVDNEGHLLSVRRRIYFIDNVIEPRRQFEIVRFDGTTETVIAFVQDRCSDAGCVNRDVVVPGNGTGSAPPIDVSEAGSVANFDAINGRLLVPIYTKCRIFPCPYTDARSVMALSGFATLFEVVQSYNPTTAALNFTVPAMPDGMAAAERFDTYYGPLVGPKDFSQAQPLRCNYPATIPQPGDYLEAGIVPDPPARQGYYYVTAATYHGQTRYGRKRENGVLSGRDPEGLPACALAPAPSVASLR